MRDARGHAEAWTPNAEREKFALDGWRRGRFRVHSNVFGGHQPQQVRLRYSWPNKFVDHPAITEYGCSIGYPHQLGDTVRDDDDTTSRFSRLADLIVKPSSGVQIKRRRGFVKDQQTRPG